MTFMIRGKCDGQPVEFIWYGPAAYDASTVELSLELGALELGDEQVGMTPEGPFYDSGFDTAEQAYATVVSVLDGGVPSPDGVFGEAPTVPSTPEGSDSSDSDTGSSPALSA